MKQLEISGKVLARNTLLNFIGQTVPLVVGVVTIPFIVRGLGTERFGLLSLAWVILGYFNIFEFGLGRATTKYVAEALGKGKSEEDQIPSLVWMAITVQAVMGLLGALVLVGITPLLVERILNIPLELVGEAKATFYLFALSIPVVFVSSSFSGVLQAAQRFDLVNAVRVPASAAVFLLPLVGLMLGLQLPGIVALVLISTFVALSALVALDLRVFPNLRRFSASFVLFPRLFSYGGWITVSSILNPILLYLERFLIASLISVAAVAYYTVPSDTVTRLWIIPASLVTTLFPAFSLLKGIDDRQQIGVLFECSIKYVVLSVGPIVLMLVVFAREILQIWLGSDFAMQSTMVFQVLAIGMLAGSLSHIPSALLQGVGRPDIPAKFHLLELSLYIGIAWVLVSQWGIAGAATAWTLRLTLDAFLLFIAAFKVCQFSPRAFATKSLKLSIILFTALAGVAYGIKILIVPFSLLIQLSAFTALLGTFAWVSWKKLLDGSERKTIFKALRR